MNRDFAEMLAALSEAGFRSRAFESAERRRIGPVLLRSRSTLNDFAITAGPTPGYVP